MQRGMTINQRWLIESRVLLFEVAGHLSSADIRHLNDAFEAALAQVQAPLYILVDASQGVVLPPHTISLWQTQTYLYHQNFAWLILIGVSPIAKFVASVVASLTKKNIRVMGSIEAALEWVHQTDEQLL